MRILDGEGAVSPVLSVLLLVLITLGVGILLYNFVMGTVRNVTEKVSPQPFSSLSIENMSINSTCITVYIRNSSNRDFTIDRVYVNDQPHDIPPLTVLIPKNSTWKVYIPGSYTIGTSYNVKITFTSGHTLMYLKRY